MLKALKLNEKIACELKEKQDIIQLIVQGQKQISSLEVSNEEWNSMISGVRKLETVVKKLEVEVDKLKNKKGIKEWFFQRLSHKSKNEDLEDTIPPAGP